jgi:hypothetical protein
MALGSTQLLTEMSTRNTFNEPSRILCGHMYQIIAALDFRNENLLYYIKHDIFYIIKRCILPEDGSSPKHVGGKIVNKA